MSIRPFAEFMFKTAYRPLSILKRLQKATVIGFYVYFNVVVFLYVHVYSTKHKNALTLTHTRAHALHHHQRIARCGWPRSYGVRVKRLVPTPCRANRVKVGANTPPPFVIANKQKSRNVWHRISIALPTLKGVLYSGVGFARSCWKRTRRLRGRWRGPSTSCSKYRVGQIHGV